eukprot:768129-Hanusia_phi.AAC.2
MLFDPNGETTKVAATGPGASARYQCQYRFRPSVLLSSKTCFAFMSQTSVSRRHHHHIRSKLKCSWHWATSHQYYA